MSQNDEELSRLECAVEALEGMVFRQRGDALMPGADAFVVDGLDRISEMLSAVRSELSTLRSGVRWRRQHSRRR